MEAEESPEEDGPLLPFVHPDDRLWRHPSEMRAPAAAPLAAPAGPTRLWALATVSGLVGALAATGVLVGTGELTRSRTVALVPQGRTDPPVTISAASVTSAPGWAAVADAVSASTATVRATTSGGTRRGSAVAFTSDARATYLLSDVRLVSGAAPIEVTFDGQLPQRAEVVRTDRTSGMAVLEVAGGGRPVATTGSIASLRVADQVLVVGGQPGGGSATVAGTVSGLGCSVTDAATGDRAEGLLAVDAPLPTGDDGAAVVDSAGAVVGLAEQITPTDPGQQAMTFVLPVDAAMRVGTAVLAGQPVTHPWLGVEAASDLDSATARAMGVGGGAQLLAIAAGSPATAAALHPDDVVTAIDGEPVTSSGAMMAKVDQATVGQVATVSYRRGASSATVSVRVAEQPGDVDGLP